MQTPEVFTPDEIDRFRSELAGKRKSGTYEPGRWSVSPLNREASATAGLPEHIRLRDSTLRSIETLPGVVATDEAKAAYLRQLVRTGVSEVVTAGARGRDLDSLRAEVELIKGENAECRAICPLVFTPESISLARDAGYDGVQIWVQGFGETSLVYERIYDRAWRKEDWRDAAIPRDRLGFLTRAARLVEHARSLDLYVATPLLMVSYLTAEMLAESCEVLLDAGATELTLFDGPGALGPEAWTNLVTLTRSLAPEAKIGLHPHNTFGLAVACAVAAARAGADVVELSVNGYCGGPGNADLAAAATAFEVLYGVDTGIRLPLLTDLSRAGEQLTGYHVAWNHPLTGREAFCWGGMDIITQEGVVDPLLHNCVEPALVGNERRIPLTPDSGAYTMAYVLERVGSEADYADVEEILARCKQAMQAEGRLLSDDEVLAIASSVAATN